MRKILSFLVLAAAATAVGQTASTVEVTFENEDRRTIWIHPTGSPEVHESYELVSSDQSSVVPLPEDRAGLSMSIIDHSSGKAASKPLADLGDAWLIAGDWTHAAAINVSVMHEGEAAASGTVYVESGGQERRQLLNPSDGGLVRFEVVPLGPYDISFEYKIDGELKRSAAVSMDKPVDPVAPVFLLEISDSIETIESGGASSTEEPEPRQDREPAEKNPAGRIIGMFIGLVVIGGVCYGIYRFVKANPKQTEEAIEKLGLKPQDPAAGVDPVQAPEPPKPVQKIVLDDAAPTPAAAGPVAAAGVQAAPNPRLVMPNGEIHLVLDGTTDVGREDGRSIAFAGETSVSRHHADLICSADKVTVRDNGSTNGTFVNGRKVEGEQELNPGDSVQFGSVTCRYEV